MSICRNGHINPDGARFCGQCGQTVEVAGGQFAVAPTGSVSPDLSRLKQQLFADLAANRSSGMTFDLQAAMAFVAGSLAAVAFLLLSLWSLTDSDSTAGAVTWSVVGCVLAYVAVRFVSKELIVGGTTMFLPLAIATVLLLFRSAIEDGNVGFPFVVGGLVLAVAWAMPILRARPALLSGSLLLVGLGLLALIQQSAIKNSADCAYDGDCLSDPASLAEQLANKSSTVALLLGIVLLGVAWTLDRRGWPSLGRTFIGVGIVFEVGGAWGVYGSSGDQTAGALLLAVAGGILIAVAASQNRKSSFVIGAVGSTLGIVFFFLALLDDSESPFALAFLLILSAVGLGVLALKKSGSIVRALTRGMQP